MLSILQQLRQSLALTRYFLMLAESFSIFDVQTPSAPSDHPNAKEALLIEQNILCKYLQAVYPVDSSVGEAPLIQLSRV
jgi:hypothetical protein